MKRITHAHPSPALVVAVLALVAGVTGAAIAQPTANTAVTKSKVKKIANKQIKKQAPTLSVAHAATAGALDGLGRALVTTSVSFDSNYPVQGFTAVSRPTTGVYCLTPTGDLNPSSDPAIVNVQWEGSTGNDLLAYWDKGGNDCPAGRYAVRTYRFPAGAPALSNNVEFLITVL